MSLKDMFKAIEKTNNSYVAGELDLYLRKKVNEENDRAINVNAPSQAGKCQRSNYYSRLQYPSDGVLDPRLKRIFDNGTKVHERLQEYLLDMGLLICDEVPLINEEYNIQGHTDGMLSINNDEVAVLEIKSINEAGFKSLMDAKEEHKQQGLIYLFCLEERRKFLHATYSSKKEFFNSKEERVHLHRNNYTHLKDGKYSREEKITHQINLHLIADDVLFDTEKPINKVVFLYENKNTQELKEFVVERNISTEHILTNLLARYKELNKCVEQKVIPVREGSSKSCHLCRWCDYKNTCWIV